MLTTRDSKYFGQKLTEILAFYVLPSPFNKQYSFAVKKGRINFVTCYHVTKLTITKTLLVECVHRWLNRGSTNGQSDYVVHKSKLPFFHILMYIRQT